MHDLQRREELTTTDDANAVLNESHTHALDKTRVGNVREESLGEFSKVELHNSCHDVDVHLFGQLDGSFRI